MLKCEVLPNIESVTTFVNWFKIKQENIQV